MDGQHIPIGIIGIAQVLQGIRIGIQTA
jgi:hypothetical protein